jgi:hypothetical protein
MAVVDKGFKHPIHFHYGKIDIKSLKSTEQNPNDQFTVMICRMAVGKTFLFPEKNKTETVPIEEKPEQMTSDFDSVFIYDEPTATKEFKL